VTITPALTVTGHVTVESVTSTGATGTGKFVFDTAPVIATSLEVPYIILGSAATAADAGAIRLPNAAYIMAEADAAGTDISVIGVDSAEIIQIGASGASGVTITPALTVTGHTVFEGVTSTGATGTGKLVYDTAPVFTTSIEAPFIILGSAATAADAGTIRLPNAGSIQFEADAAGTDINALSVDSAEIVQIGATGASAVTITPATTITGTLTANGNAVFGDADTDTVTLRGVVVGGDRTGTNDAVQIAATLATPTYATATNSLYVAGVIETAGTVYAAGFNTGSGSDGTRGITFTTNTAFTPTGDQMYYINDILYFSEGGGSPTQKQPVKIQDAQTITGRKTFTGGIDTGSATVAGDLRVYDGSDNYVTITAPSLSGNWIFTLPAVDGDNGQVLSTNGSGVTSWAAPAATVAGSDTQVQFNNASAFGGDAGFTFNTTTDKLTLGTSGGATTGSLELYYTGTTYAGTIVPNAAMAADVTITLPSYTTTLLGAGANTFTGNQLLDDGTGASPSLTFQDGTDETAAFSKVDAGYLTLTTDATDGLNILVGNLKVGNGTPTQTLNGEDGYVEGTFEVDGAMYADGGLTVGSTLAMGANNITGTGSLGATGAGKLTKLWAVDAEFTNGPSVNGVAANASLGLIVNPMTTAGDIILGGTNGAAGRLGIQAAGYVLAGGTTAAWSNAPQITSIELGAATDTTIARTSAGIINVEGANVIMGTLGATTNVIPKANGTGTATLQASGITEDGTNVNIGALNLVSTGTISGKMPLLGTWASPITSTGAYALSAANAYGRWIYYNDTDEITLPAAVAGMSVCVQVPAATLVPVGPNGTDVIVLEGTALSAGQAFSIAAVAGNFACVVADAANHWVSAGTKGTLTAIP
jgi:hypothetical protein